MPQPKLSMRDVFDIDPEDHTPEQAEAMRERMTQVIAKLRLARKLKAVEDARIEADEKAKAAAKAKSKKAKKEITLDTIL